ncbi:imidazole glycerol phosphate synthase subunit HisF [Paramagnetospirillum kuznetsovii]|uniref:Imidazole glycerol phosphate synthase subunit HisF n=1 Tax=Paramagnetospirillum kuznetsovii TaxID=2053833 RepID=A0A364NT63_9PROT|nr:imidazole glycerol phosphate synthase cyclase subunit [Paramagnetospirillum kuznetsovii]RAU20258.1 imidazole glycerol phosphate synthase subunit HisF [Paramagnetospirillum kuznetsovii]
MSAAVRLIAHMEIKGEHVTKGMRMEGLRRVGAPDALMESYFSQGADELLFTDIVASLYDRRQLLALLEIASRRIFVPVTAGGGVRSMDDFHALLQAGADKVSINTQALRTPDLIGLAARTFGSQCVIVSIQAKKRGDHYEAYVDHARQPTGKDAVAWAMEAENRGAGELLVTAIDQDGVGRGPDLDLLQRMALAVKIPVIAAGGVRGGADIAAIVERTGLDAVAMARALHLDGQTLSAIKAALEARGIATRPADLAGEPS